ncbi:MAG: hypothetical protein D3908_04205, partial [Candidatus Electrothrix sp. AUS4]|nr:hypothetical protein [Candidatus Electrothrix sp. AUS4]
MPFHNHLFFCNQENPLLICIVATNLRRDSLQNQAIAQAVASLFMARLLPNSEISEPELLSRLKLVAHL